MFRARDGADEHGGLFCMLALLLAATPTRRSREPRCRPLISIRRRPRLINGQN